MELVDGTDLSDLVRSVGPLSPADASELIRQAAIGLQQAHEKGMVHRDIKPSNLMLAKGKHGQLPLVKVLDMGLALLDDGNKRQAGDLTSTGQMMGTLDYMAPEQGMDSHEVDVRADVYSLGATLYKLLCGEPPFAGEKYDTPVKMVRALALETASSIVKKRGDLPAELVAVVDRMLAKQPENRFGTAAEVATALAPLAEGANLEELACRAAETAAPAGDADHKSRSTEPVASSALRETNSNMDVGSRVESTSSLEVEPEPVSKAQSTDSLKPRGWHRNRRNQITLAGAAAALILLAGRLSSL